MESRFNNLEDQKQKVLNFIETQGPTWPMKIVSFLKSESLIVSAFLSELLEERKLKISSMKVGNSPIYYIRGQEFQLEKFSHYLGGKEREAFDLLKEYGILMDEKLPPPIRVALRSIKDFAFPFEYNNNIYWRYIKLSQDKAVEIIKSRQKSSEKPKEHKPLFEKIREAVLPKEPVSLIEKSIQTDFQKEPLRKQGVEIEKKKTEFITETNGLKIDDEKPLLKLKQPKIAKEKQKSDFVFEVINFLEKKEFFINKEIEYKKKEYYADVKIDTQLGKVNYLCIAKDKKTITENDLVQALQICNDNKKPVLLISKGDPSKKSAKRLEEIGNLVFFQKLE